MFFTCIMCLLGLCVLAVAEDMEVRSTVVSSCWETSGETDVDLVQSEVSTSQEMSYVCHQFSSELKRKLEVDEVQSVIE